MNCFLDRDGIINIDKKYVGTIDRFVWYEEIFDTLNLLKKVGYKFKVITNQSGINRGYYSMDQFLDLSFYMLSTLKEKGLDIEIRFCPHLPEQNCNCRKPKAAMIKCYQISDKDIFIGDNETDMVAAKMASIKNRWLVSDIPKGPYTHHFKHHKDMNIFVKKNFQT